MPLQGTNVSCINGEVFVKQGTIKKKFVGSLKLKENAEVERGENSYADLIDNPSPDSGKQSSSATLLDLSLTNIKGDD